MRTRIDSSAPSPGRSAIGGLIALAAAMGIGRFAFTPILPSMMAEQGIGPDAAGLIAAANYGGYLAGAVAASMSWAAGRERRLVLVSLACSAGLLALMAMTDDLWLFCLIRFLAGLASAFVMVFAASLVLGQPPAAGRPWVQSVHFAGVGTGMAVSSLVAGSLSLASAPVEALWLAMAAIGLIAILAVAWLVPEPATSEGEAPTHEPKLRWTSPLLRLTLAYGLFGFGYIITATFVVAIVRDGGGSPAFEMLVWLVAGLAAAVSVAVGQPIAARHGPLRLFTVGCLIEAAGVAASVLLPSPAGPLIGGLVLGCTFVLITAYGLQAGRLQAPLSGRRVFASMTAIFGIGQIAGPVFAGWASAVTGSYTLASLVAAAALVAAAIVAGRS
jgi:predicted MFS family arabinose efflux permease